jgi:hypothetical protein
MLRSQIASLTFVAAIAVAPAALAQGQVANAPPSGGYVGQMTEEQIKQKIQGEGFSEVSEVKKIPVTKYRWTAKAVRNGKPMEVTIDELGKVSAK